MCKQIVHVHKQSDDVWKQIADFHDQSSDWCKQTADLSCTIFDREALAAILQVWKFSLDFTQSYKSMKRLIQQYEKTHTIVWKESYDSMKDSY